MLSITETIPAKPQLCTTSEVRVESMKPRTIEKTKVTAITATIIAVWTRVGCMYTDASIASSTTTGAEKISSERPMPVTYVKELVEVRKVMPPLDVLGATVGRIVNVKPEKVK